MKAKQPLTWVQSPNGKWHLYGGVCTAPPEEDTDWWVLPPLPAELCEILDRLLDQNTQEAISSPIKIPISRGGGLV